jgi:hypothetical protein
MQTKKQIFFSVLREDKTMFNGSLGIYSPKKVHIDIDPNAKPVHSRPYPVPEIHLQTFKMDLNHLVRIGALTPQQESEWVSPSFITQKKGRQSTLDQQLTSTEQSHSTQAIYIANNNRHFCASILGTSFSLNLTLVCTTIRLNFTKKVKISVPS